MTRITQIMQKKLPEIQLLSVRKTIHFFEEYSDFMGEAVGKIEERIKEADSYPSSGPIVCFHNIDIEKLDVEIGFQIAEPITGKGAVKYSVLPARTIATAIGQGPYEQQDPTMEELMKWISDNGYQPTGGIYYHYLNDDQRPEEELLTEMYLPITKQS